eukprot:Amastigsp_a182067_10.p4 type:complete len:191 gc:universal Amastigsp_a182067_10:1208-1780(+)
MAPPKSMMPSWTTRSNMCGSGRYDRCTSLLRSSLSPPSMPAARSAMRLPLVISTPLGLPVVPDVKQITQRSSGAVDGGSRRRAPLGLRPFAAYSSNAKSASPTAFAFFLAALSRGSSWTTVLRDGMASFASSRRNLEVSSAVFVTTTRIEHRFTQNASASSPSVSYMPPTAKPYAFAPICAVVHPAQLGA